MSQKAEAANPLNSQKPQKDEHFEGEFEELSQKVFKGTGFINSLPSDPLEPTTPKHPVQKRSSIFFKKKSTKDDRHDSRLYEEVKNEKKVVLLKNYSAESGKDPLSREDYLILLSFICIYGENYEMFNELKEKSQYLSGLIVESPKELLRQREYISQVLISAANQNEDLIIKEIMKTDTLGYIVSIPVILAFIKADLHALLKPLMKVMDHNYKNSLKALRGFIPDNLMSKGGANPQIQLKQTLRNIGSGSIADDAKKPLFNNSVISEQESLIKDGQGKSPATSPIKSAKNGGGSGEGFFAPRALPPKSSHLNVTIECKFENILPYLIQLNKMDIVDSLVDSFGENKTNHLNLLIQHQQEEAALKYYKKRPWDLTEAQAIMLSNKHMWTFLCNIDDDLDRALFFSDDVFENVRDKLQDGKILTEIVLFFMTLPINGWKQNQAVALMELASGLLRENPDFSRLVYASNPIMTCAQLSFILTKLSRKFRFIQNDLEVLAQKMQQIALLLQEGYRETNLYSLYLSPLPTGLTMLDYVLRMGLKDLVESKFTKGLVLELWNNDSFVTGSKKQISSVFHSLTVAKKFSWKHTFKPQLQENFSFEFGNVITSAKSLLYTDLFFIVLLFIFLDIYIYDKIGMFRDLHDDPNLLNLLPSYTLDVAYHRHPFRTVFILIILINYWIFFFIRTIHISRQSIKSSNYSVAYLFTFLFLTLTLLTLFIFPSYESQADYHVIIKLVLIFTRTSVVFVGLATMLGLQKTGQSITVIGKVAVSLTMILLMLALYMLLVGEMMNNFFRRVDLFNSVEESFFSLTEIFFGSLTFPNMSQFTENFGIYYTTNFFIFVYSFTSTLLSTFLLIAYLTSSYEVVRNEASYLNTLTQYNYIELYTKSDWKGFYSFPPIIFAGVVPLFFTFGIPPLKEKINFILLKVRFYMTWVVFQVAKYIITNSFYYGPGLYFKNLLLIFSNKMSFEGSKFLHFFGWLFGGPFVIAYQMGFDLKVLFKVFTKDYNFENPREKLYLRVTDDDVIYLQRYETLQAGLMSIVKENPEIKTISYLELLNFLMNGGKIKTVTDGPRSMLHAKDTINEKQRRIELIRKYAKRIGGSKWLRSIYDAKKKFFREILDGFLNYKTHSMKIEDATIDPKVALEILENVSEKNIMYVRARQIFAIQLVLLATQSKDQISTMNKIDELEKKIDRLIRIYVTQYGEHKDFKWSRIIEAAQNMNGVPGSLPAEGGEGGPSKAAVFGTLVT